MQASAERSAATRSGDPKRFLRPRPPVWTQANARTTSRDRPVAAALGQTSDSHLPLHASKAEGHSQPHPDHLPGLCGSREVPCRDFPGSKRSSLPPKRHLVSWGLLPLPVPRFVLARRCALPSDRRPPNPASTAPRKDSDVRLSENLRWPRLESRRIERDFGREGRGTPRWTAPVELLFGYSATRVSLPAVPRNMRAQRTTDTVRLRSSSPRQNKNSEVGTANQSASESLPIEAMASSELAPANPCNIRESL